MSTPTKAPTASAPHPTWAAARKDMVGASLGSSRLWFTIAEGIVTEVYYPRIDIPQIKDLGFIIADDHGFWVELRRLECYSVSLPVPACRRSRSSIAIPASSSRCESVRRSVATFCCCAFRLEGDAALRPYALLSARLGGDADEQRAPRSDRHNGRKALWAEQGPFGLALSGGRRRWRATLGALLRSAARRRATAGRTSTATAA